VRDAFIRYGVDAVSCDLLPSETPGPHIQDDVLNHLDDGWDLGIFFPDCTHLAVSGARYWKEKKADGRQDKAVEFFMRLVKAPIPRIALENPVGIMSTLYRQPDQIIQPWQFGDDASKRTCLWLRNLPPLYHTRIIRKVRYSNQTPSGQNKLGPSPDRARERSRTYPGIAEAMAKNWHNLRCIKKR
jgi:hypothetical protein